MRELHHLHILHGRTQEQLTLLRESYNARFDHLARSLPPDVLKPAALCYDHFIKIPLRNTIAETVNYNFSPIDLPPGFEAYDQFLRLLRQKPGDGGTAITFLHSKLHSFHPEATARSTVQLVNSNPDWLGENWHKVGAIAQEASKTTSNLLTYLPCLKRLRIRCKKDENKSPRCLLQRLQPSTRVLRRQSQRMLRKIKKVQEMPRSFPLYS